MKETQELGIRLLELSKNQIMLRKMKLSLRIY